MLHFDIFISGCTQWEPG